MPVKVTVSGDLQVEVSDCNITAIVKVFNTPVYHKVIDLWEAGTGVVIHVRLF